jgi:NAD(P)-dependent dehydrogenase (short-subunit alcohol dehydrogenase family)
MNPSKNKKNKGKIVLVTGAARGIGYHTVKEFAHAGYRVIMTDINEEMLQGAADSFAKEHHGVFHRRVDVTSQDEVNALAAWVEEQFGSLDILINNAGIGHNGELAETSIETWKKLINVNLLGPLYHIYAFLPLMKRQGSGHIVNISSGQLFFRLPSWGAYASIKAALGIFSEILHFELHRHNIIVSTIYPYLVSTPFYEKIEIDSWLARLTTKVFMMSTSITPEKAGRIIFRAVEKKRTVEMVTILNSLASIAQAIPFGSEALGYTSALFLTKKS